MYKRNQFSIFSLGRTEQLRINYRCPNYGLLTLIRYCQQPLLILFNKQWFGKISPYLKTPMMVFSLIKGELCAIIIYQKNIFSLITKVKPFKFWHSLLSQLTCASPYRCLLCSSFHQSVSPAIGAFRQTIAWPVQLVCAVQGIVYSGKCAGWGTYCEEFSVQ